MDYATIAGAEDADDDGIVDSTLVEDVDADGNGLGTYTTTAINNLAVTFTGWTCWDMTAGTFDTDTHAWTYV